MRVLVIGASGFVGSALMDAFAGEAVGTYYDHPKPKLLPLDMRDRTAVARLVAEVAPAWILVPAAQPHVDWCEQHAEESRAVNLIGPATVAEVAREARARVLFFSTDYVFDGSSGPYREEDTPAPLNVYGAHKWAAEKAVLDSDPNNLVLRVCGVYGYERPAKNFVMTLRSRLQAGEEVRVPADQWGTPTYVRDVALAAKRLVEAGACGVWHVAGPDYLPRDEFARRVCSAYALDARKLIALPTVALGQRAPRPLRGGLRSERLAALGFSCRGIDAGLAALAAEIEANEAGSASGARKS